MGVEGGRKRSTWREGIALVSVLGVAWVAPVPAGSLPPLLAEAPISGHGVALSPADRDSARALAEGVRALEAGELDVATDSLEMARARPVLGDYVDLYRARVLSAKGKQSEAAALAAATCIAYPASPLLPELHELQGAALAATGDEAGARKAWSTALDGTDDLERRRSIKLAIVSSRQRSGELDQSADPDQLIAQSFPGSTLPGESPPGARTPRMALLAAEDLASRGRGALAIDAFREALAGQLSPDEVERARMGLGLALFRLREYEEAVTVFAALGKDPKGRFWHARSTARAGRTTLALGEFEALAKDGPPEYASRSAYLAATLLEDRGETARAMEYYEQAAGYEAFPERVRVALWRLGWSALRRGEHDEARRRFSELASRHDDPLEALRPRYWAARAAEQAGAEKRARAELAVIARDYPLDYYGWRAQQRIGVLDTRARAGASPAGGAAPRRTLPEASLARVALLLEADLADGAHRELVPLADRARTMPDRVTVGGMLVSAGDYHRAQRLVVEAYSLPLAQGVRDGQEALFWLSWPPAYRELVEAALPPDSRIEPALVWAIMREESGFRPEVMSSAGAMGLLQLMPETASRMARQSGRETFEAESLFTPETNIQLGSVYLDHLVGRFPGRLSAAIGSYNAGPLAVARWLHGPLAQLEDDVWVEDIPYGQTRSYVKRVLRSLHVYRSFY